MVSLGQAVSEDNIFLYQPIRNNNFPWQPGLLSNQDEMNKFYTGPPIDASCTVLFHLVKQFQRRRFLKTQQIRIKNCPWWPCLLYDRDEMNKLYKGSPIDASCKVWFHWPIGFRGEDFWKLNQSELRVAHVSCPIETKWTIFIKDLP